MCVCVRACVHVGGDGHSKSCATVAAHAKIFNCHLIFLHPSSAASNLVKTILACCWLGDNLNGGHSEINLKEKALTLLKNLRNYGS